MSSRRLMTLIRPRNLARRESAAPAGRVMHHQPITFEGARPKRRAASGPRWWTNGEKQAANGWTRKCRNHEVSTSCGRRMMRRPSAGLSVEVFRRVPKLIQACQLVRHDVLQQAGARGMVAGGAGAGKINRSHARQALTTRSVLLRKLKFMAHLWRPP